MGSTGILRARAAIYQWRVSQEAAMQTAAFKSAPFQAPQAVMATALLEDHPAAVDTAGVRMHYDRDEEIFGDGEPSRNVYRVVSGAVRTYRVLSDGRRQIVEFHLAGDVFGLDGDQHHHLSAEAVGEVTLQVIRRSVFLSDRTDGSSSVVEALLKKCQRAEDHMLLLGRHTACERVAAFLLDFQRRTRRAELELPMSRQDMADYLGLTIETVSRTMTQLAGSGMIDLVSCRRIVLRNVAALDRICQ
jgi:CRP/FNR family nitrogen fixation transcriptional regulator